MRATIRALSQSVTRHPLLIISQSSVLLRPLSDIGKDIAIARIAQEGRDEATNLVSANSSARSRWRDVLWIRMVVQAEYWSNRHIVRTKSRNHVSSHRPAANENIRVVADSDRFFSAGTALCQKIGNVNLL